MRANITALRRSLPVSHMLASQPASNSPLEHVTPHIKHQDLVNVRAFISISDIFLSRRSYYLLIIIQLID